jgi:hypothetical protein
MTATAATDMTTGHAPNAKIERGTEAQVGATLVTALGTASEMSSRQGMKNAIGSDTARTGMMGIVDLSKGKTDATRGAPIGESVIAAELYSGYRPRLSRTMKKMQGSPGVHACFREPARTRPFEVRRDVYANAIMLQRCLLYDTILQRAACRHCTVTITASFPSMA